MERALREISSAHLPDGSRPVLTGEAQFVRNTLAVRTNVIYGRLPLGNETRGDYDSEGHLFINVKITSLDFIGTQAVNARPARSGHPAVSGHSAIPATYEDGTPRIFEMTLAHELGHAARIIRHQTFHDFLIEEHLVTNLENQYRYARGVEQRKRYGDMDLKQYP